MIYNPDKHHRRSIRLKGYDYSKAGVYFVTICVQDRECLLGQIINGQMKLADAGEMIQDWWNRLPQKYANIELDDYIIMPNHIHGILILHNDVGASLVGAQNNTINTKKMKPPQTTNKNNINKNVYSEFYGAGTRPAPTNIYLTDVIGSFKSITTNEYIKGIQNSNWPPFNRRLWQRNYYEHIVRSENELNRIIKYIIENLARWDEDYENPEKMVKTK